MLRQPRLNTGSLLVRSTLLASVLIAAVSAPSFAAPQPPQAGYFTATQDDVPYGEVPRQLILFNSSATTAGNVPGTTTTIASAAKNGLPRSLSISSGGGGAPQLKLPGLAFIPATGQSLGGDPNAAVRSPLFRVREVRSNTGLLDQTEKNIVQFSF